MNIESTTAIDLSYLELTFGNNKEVIHKILTSFLEKTPKQVKELENFAASSKWNDVKLMAHKIKTSFNTVGAKEVGALLAEIEEEALNGQADEVWEKIDQIKVLSTTVFSAVKNELN